MVLCFSKELAEAVRFRTHDWNVLVSNPAAYTISSLKDPIAGIKKINTHIFYFNLETFKMYFIFFYFNGINVYNVGYLKYRLLLYNYPQL